MKIVLAWILSICFSLALRAQCNDVSAFFSKAMSNPTEKKGATFFLGQIHKGKRNGMGVLASNKKTIYVGDFVKGTINGYGMQISSANIKNCENCFVYVGNWKNGKKHGYGKCYSSNGDLIYKGEFKSDKPVQDYPGENLFSSMFFSKIEFVNGDVYLGEITDGKPDGFGLVIYFNGDMLQCRFNEGYANGIGLLLHNNSEWETLNMENNEILSVVSSSVTYRNIDNERKKIFQLSPKESAAMQERALFPVTDIIDVQQQSSFSVSSGQTGNVNNESNNNNASKGGNLSEITAMQMDKRTYSNYESQLAKMKTYWETQYNDSIRRDIQQNMKKIRQKWESRGYKMFRSPLEDWNGKKM